MAAGLGFKTFTTGEVLTAGDVNGYLMQGINVFTNATARDAAITAPAEGQFAFTKDNNSLWYYDGAAWVASGATGDIEGVTAGVGISGGGTSGTVTVTNSMATAIDAKGDLVPGTGADTFARLAVGANGTVLTADSAEATGLKWATPASGSGLTLVSSTTFSGVSSQSVNNCFSSTYDNYKIVITYTNFSGTNNAQVRMRLRASGTDNTSTYFTANNYYYGGTTTDTSYENTNGFLTGYASTQANERNSLNVIDIMSPYIATETVMSGIGSVFLSNLGHAYAQRYAGTSFVQSSFDGFTLIPASDTITGKVRVYGYSN
jgi:hypothetical protein